MTFMKRSIFALLAVVLAGGPVLAHHSYAKFITDQTVSVEGDLQSIVFASPHVVLTMRGVDAHIYTVTWSNALQLTRDGMTRSTLKVGDHVVVSGSPARDPEDHELSLIKEVSRPADGWRWSSRPRPLF